CSEVGSTAGQCETCADGYFRNSNASPTSDSCLECDPTCLTCSAAGESGCKSCKDGYFLGATINTAGKCIKCDNVDDTNWKGVVGCLKCTTSGAANTPATCTECQADRYLKAKVGDTAETCETKETCTGGYFPKDESTGGNKCVKCSDTDNGGIADCAKCSLVTSSTRAGVAVTCTECGSGKKLSPLKDACLTACPAGTYDSSNVCTPCHTSCAECNSNANQDSCTACYPGSVLNKTDSLNTGTCIPECTGRYAENCEANQCTAVLGGSKYCSRCKSGFVPVDGLCVSSGTTRAPPAGCTPGTDGTCSACTDTYFKESGGCYLSTAYPGKTLCSQASNGQCSQCANGQTQNNGIYPACDPTCATCETGKSQECKTCFSGYYFDVTNKVCKKCSENSADGKIQGVENCVSCAPPASSGTVTCYVTQTPTVNR
ncbi:Variant-specific surface protein, partial [Giardia duodenalis]